MLTQLRRRRVHERVPAGVDPRPLRGGVLQEGLSVRVTARADPCVRGVLPGDGTGERPEVPRGELWQMLLNSLPAGTVRWGHKVTAVRALDEGRHQVDFADNTTIVADLLIGADGAWSRVRPLLSEAVPEYFGVCSVETFLSDAGTRHPASAEAVGAGSLFALASGRGLLAREGGGTLLGDAAHLRAPNGEGANLAMQDGAELGQALAAHPGDAEAALAAHEQAMFARTAVEAHADGFYTIMIDNSTPRSLLALMTGPEQDA